MVGVDQAAQCRNEILGLTLGGSDGQHRATRVDQPGHDERAQRRRPGQVELGQHPRPGVGHRLGEHGVGQHGGGQAGEGHGVSRSGSDSTTAPCR